MKYILILVCLATGIALFAGNATQANDVDKKKIKVRYKKQKRLDFESLLVEGETKRPDFSVVAGNLGEDDLGLLKLREDFIDLMADDAGEEIR